MVKKLALWHSKHSYVVLSTGFFAIHRLLKRWCSNWRSPMKLFSHVGHVYVLKWPSMCALRSSLVANFFSHISHWYCRSLSAWISSITLVVDTVFMGFWSCSSSLISMYSTRSVSLPISKFGTAHTLSCLLTLNVNICSGKCASHMTCCRVILFTSTLTASHQAFRLKFEWFQNVYLVDSESMELT